MKKNQLGYDHPVIKAWRANTGYDSGELCRRRIRWALLGGLAWAIFEALIFWRTASAELSLISSGEAIVLSILMSIVLILLVVLGLLAARVTYVEKHPEPPLRQLEEMIGLERNSFPELQRSADAAL